jgi:hypothetical protein
MHFICHTHFIFLDIITLMILHEKSKVWGFWLCNFLQSSIISLPLNPKILSSTQFPASFPGVRRQVLHSYRERCTLMYPNFRNTVLQPHIMYKTMFYYSFRPHNSWCRSVVFNFFVRIPPDIISH